MQRCNDCGSVDLGRMRAERTGECLWVCGECAAVWRDGEDLVGPSSADVGTYVPPPGGAEPAEFIRVPEPPGERLSYPRAVRAIADLVSVGYYDPFMLGMSVAEAAPLIGRGADGAAPLAEDRWAPREGRFHIRISAGEVVEIDIAPPDGPLPMPAGLPPGPDLSLINIPLAEEAITAAQGSFAKIGEFMGHTRVDFGTSDTGGELHFLRYRLIRARVRPAG